MCPTPFRQWEKWLVSSPELKWLSRNLGAVLKREGRFETRFPHLCQGRNEMPQNRRSKVPQKRRLEKSPASVVLLHRGRPGKMTEHAGFQFLLQAIALAANVDGDGMMQQAVQDGRRDHMVVKNVTPGAVALVAG